MTALVFDYESTGRYAFAAISSPFFLHKGVHAHVQKTKAVFGRRPWHRSTGLYAHTRNSFNIYRQQELILLSFLFFIALFLMILIVRYARKVKSGFIVSTILRLQS